MAQPRPTTSARAQLLELLAKSLGAPDGSVAQALDIASALPSRAAQLSPPEAKLQAEAVFLQLQDVARLADQTMGGDRAARLDVLQRKFMSAGDSASGMAAFRDKPGLLSLLKELSSLPSSTQQQGVAHMVGANVVFQTRNETGADAGLRELPRLASLDGPSRGSAGYAPNLTQPPAPEGSAIISDQRPNAASALYPSIPDDARAAAEPPAAFLSTLGARAVPPPYLGVLSEDAEQALVREMMFVLQGVSSSHVRLPSTSEGLASNLITCNATIGGEHIGVAARHIVGRVGELGVCYKRICVSIHTDGGTAASLRLTGGGSGARPAGSVRRAVDAAIRAELDSYFRSLAQLSSRMGAAAVAEDAAAAAAGSAAVAGTAAVATPEAWTLRRLHLWAQEHLPLMRHLAATSEAVANLHGGALASAIHSSASSGDPTITATLGLRLLAAAAEPVTAMVLQWVSSGELPPELGAAEGGASKGGATGSEAGVSDYGSDRHPVPWGGSEFFVVRPSASPQRGAGEAGTSAPWKRRLGSMRSDPDAPPLDGLLGDYNLGGGGDAGAAGDFHGFRLNPSQLPEYIPSRLAVRILETGAIVHFIREVCADGAWVNEHVTARIAAVRAAFRGAGGPPPHHPSSLLLPGDCASEYPPAAYGAAALVAAQAGASLAALEGAAAPASDPTGVRVLGAAIEAIQSLVNARAVHQLRSVHHLALHLSALRRYVLLGQGDFVSVFMAAVAPELHRPATAIATATHVLDGILDSAIHASNAGREGRDTLARLNVRLLSPSPGDTGWDVLCLHYHTGPPLSAVVTPAASAAYARLFTFLWRLKRVDHSLCSLWSAQATASHTIRRLGHAGLDFVLHRCNLLRSDMMAFVNTLTSYLMFEAVAECAQTLDAAVASAASLGELCAAHDAFLSRLLHRMFLTARTEEVSGPLGAILSEALAFSAVQEGVLAAALAAVAAMRAHEADVARRTAEGAWGVPSGAAEDDEQVMAAVTAALNKAVGRYGPLVQESAAAYRTGVTQLLFAIEVASQREGLDELRMLAFRLDYNDFYGGGAISAV